MSVAVQEFAGNVAVITGAASGIGNAIAHYFTERGARILGMDLNDSIASGVVELPGGGRRQGRRRAHPRKLCRCLVARRGPRPVGRLMEWAPIGVTVNAVSPTVVENPLGKAA